MTFFKNRRFHNRRFHKPQFEAPPEAPEAPDSGTTGEEAQYLKSLIDSRSTITVVLTTGERLRGRIRYYDRYCFSLGPAGGGPKIFLRKDNVRYIEEETDPKASTRSGEGEVLGSE
jgi:small nuclear ribonucleoprotein (snRNP)-like protein